jgi:hypothetical protein
MHAMSLFISILCVAFVMTSSIELVTSAPDPAVRECLSQCVRCMSLFGKQQYNGRKCVFSCHLTRGKSSDGYCANKIFHLIRWYELYKMWFVHVVSQICLHGNTILNKNELSLPARQYPSYVVWFQLFRSIGIPTAWTKDARYLRRWQLKKNGRWTSLCKRYSLELNYMSMDLVNNPLLQPSIPYTHVCICMD